MAALSIIGQMKVSKLQERFLKEFGLTLRVYDGRSFADPTQTLGQVRKKKGSGKGLSVAKNMKVGNLEDKFEEEFGLKVQVAGSDDSYLCDNNLTLNAAQQADEKKLSRKTKKEARQDEISDDVRSEVSDDEKDENIRHPATVSSKMETGKTESKKIIEDNDLETDNLISEKIIEVQTDDLPNTIMKAISLNELMGTKNTNEIQLAQNKLIVDYFSLITGEQVDDDNLEKSTQPDTDNSSPQNKFMKEVKLSNLDLTKESANLPKLPSLSTFIEFDLKD